MEAVEGVANVLVMENESRGVVVTDNSNHSMFRFYINAKTTTGRVCNERDQAGTNRASLFQE